MSFRKQLIVAPSARRDILTIVRYTAAKWGPSQALAYRQKLEAAFARIAELPGLGTIRPDLPADCRALGRESHLIVYRTRQDAVEIVRVLHQRMNRKDLL